MISPNLVFKFVIEGCGSHAQCFRSVWTVPSDLPYLNGHFPNLPIVPAVAIVDASLEFIKQAQGLSKLDLKGVKSAKFLNPVIPELEVEIEGRAVNEGEWLVEWKTRSEPNSIHLLARLAILV